MGRGRNHDNKGNFIIDMLCHECSDVHVLLHMLRGMCYNMCALTCIFDTYAVTHAANNMYKYFPIQVLLGQGWNKTQTIDK